MRKSAIGLAILMFLVLAGLILAPALVDLDRLKPEIAAQLSVAAGRSVELDGPLGLALLPGLTVTAHDVRLTNPPGASVRDMVRLRALEVKLAFWPLLRGVFMVESASLIEPEIDLEHLPGGDGNWHLAGNAAAPGGIFVLALDRLRIDNGAVTYRSPVMVERFEHINASITLRGPAGPFEANGTLVSHGASLTFALRSGAIDAAEVPLRATVTATPAARLELDALVKGGADHRQISGNVKLTAANFQAVATTLARAAVPAAMAQPFALSGSFTGSSQALVLEPLAMDLGKAHGEGRLSLDIGAPLALALKLSVPRLDLDGWAASHMPALAPLPAPPRGDAVVAPVDPTAPVPLKPPPASAPAVTASIDLQIGSMLWRGDVIRNAAAKASIAGDALKLERLQALLPGGAGISLTGDATLAPEGPRADGAVEANADDFRGLLGWLGVAADAVPADRLRKAALSARFALAGDRLDLSGIDANLDTTRLTGAATVALRERPGVGLRLAADRFNLDAYLPESDVATAAGAVRSVPKNALPDLDANLDLRIATLTWHGQPLGDVHLAGLLQQGDLTLRDLSIADIGGASATVSGALDGLGGDTPKGQLAFDLHGPELEHVLRIVSPAFATGRLYGDFKLVGALRPEGDNLSLDAALDLLGGHAHLAGSLAPGGADLALDLDHPSFAGLMRQASPVYQPVSDPGAVKLAAHLAGTFADVTVDRLALAIGESTLEGSAALRLEDVRPHLAADLKLGDWRLDDLLPRRQTADLGAGPRRAAMMPGVLLAEARGPASSWWQQPLDLGVLALADVDLKLAAHSIAYGQWRLDEPALAAQVADGSLDIARFAGGVWGGSVEASGRLGAAAAPALDLRLALKDLDLKQVLEEAAGVGAIEGRLDGEATLGGAGKSPDDIVAHLAGDAALKAHDGRIAGIDLVALEDRLSVPASPPDVLALLRAGAGGHTAFSTLAGSFRIADGVARSDDLHLAAEVGEGSASASIDLRQETMASRVSLRFPSIAGAPPFVITLDGPLAEPRIVFDTNALQRFLVERQRH